MTYYAQVTGKVEGNDRCIKNLKKLNCAAIRGTITGRRIERWK